MKKQFLMATAILVVSLACLQAGAKTRVQLWFDTEDYTWDRSNDAIRELANILTEEGVRGHFNIVGQLGKFLIEKRREDVLTALKPHILCTQTFTIHIIRTSPK